MIGTAQLPIMAEFYQKIFGRPADMSDESYYGWLVGQTYFNIGEHSEVTGSSKEPSRIMFNLETPQVQEEFKRIKDMGATIIQEPYEMAGMWIATLADPDGNYFQLMSPWEDDK